MSTMLAPAVKERMAEFLGMIQLGVGSYSAAVACGWTIRQLKELESNPQFQEAMAAATIQKIESVEAKAFELARAGNVPMIQMILYSHAGDRGWRPPAQRVAIHHQGTVVVEKIQATKAALLSIMQDHGVEALAIGGPLDKPIIDAEVIEDGIVDAD